MSVYTVKNLLDKDSVLDYLKNIKPFIPSYMGVYFSLGNFVNKYRSEYQMKIATNIISDILCNKEDKKERIFVVKNMDIVVVFNTNKKEYISKAVYSLRHLFFEDDTSYSDGVTSSFFKVYDLCLQWDSFVLVISEKIEGNEDKSNIDNKIDNSFIEGSANLNVSSIIFIEKELRKLNIMKFVDFEDIYLFKTHHIKEKMFEYARINIEKVIKDTYFDNISIELGALFSYIKNHLNIMLLNSIKDNKTFSTINIELTIENLMSKSFYNFLSRHKNLTLIIDINIMDYLSYPDSYQKKVRSLIAEVGITSCVRFDKVIIKEFLNDFDICKIVDMGSQYLNYNIISGFIEENKNKKFIIEGCKEVNKVLNYRSHDIAYLFHDSQKIC